MNIHNTSRFILALAIVAVLGLGVIAGPASALAAASPNSTAAAESPTAGTQAIRSFDKTFTSYSQSYMTTCGLRLVGKDYGNSVVLSAIYVRSGEDAIADLGSPTLGMTARSASGGILRSVSRVQPPDVWWSTGAPAGSIGDNGQVRMTGSYGIASYNCSILVKMHQL